MIKENAVKNYFNKFETAAPKMFNKFLDHGKKIPSKVVVSKPVQRPLNLGMQVIEQLKN